MIARVELSRKQRRTLAKNAHNLDPVVMIGHAGLTDGVVEATNLALDHHELIKVRFQAHKESKREIAADLAARLSCDIVQIIGNVVVLYRERSEPLVSL